MSAAFEEFGPYLVYERLGQGGMATVHRAEKRGVGIRRPVALKRLLPHIASDPGLVELFVDEARLASQLHHANVAQTYELGKVGDTFFIAMEYASGPTLAQIVRQCHDAAGEIPLPITIGILSQVCEALDYAHNLCDASGQPLRIVHRDVSPANIIVTNTGIVKLIDFGIAKTAISRVKTQTGFIKGKFGYIAPEYLVGKIDARADLFALGVIAHETMSGRRLFEGKDDFETLAKIREMKIAPPSHHNSLITPEIDQIVMTALQRNPAERWQTASELQVALTQAARQLGAVVGSVQLAEWVAWAFSQVPSSRARGDDSAHKTGPFARDANSSAPREISSETSSDLPSTTLPEPIRGRRRARSESARTLQLARAAATGSGELTPSLALTPPPGDHPDDDDSAVAEPPTPPRRTSRVRDAVAAPAIDDDRAGDVGDDDDDDDDDEPLRRTSRIRDSIAGPPPPPGRDDDDEPPPRRISRSFDAVAELPPRDRDDESPPRRTSRIRDAVVDLPPRRTPRSHNVIAELPLRAAVSHHDIMAGLPEPRPAPVPASEPPDLSLILDAIAERVEPPADSAEPPGLARALDLITESPPRRSQSFEAVQPPLTGRMAPALPLAPPPAFGVVATPPSLEGPYNAATGFGLRRAASSQPLPPYDASTVAIPSAPRAPTMPPPLAPPVAAPVSPMRMFDPLTPTPQPIPRPSPAAEPEPAMPASIAVERSGKSRAKATQKTRPASKNRAPGARPGLRRRDLVLRILLMIVLGAGAMAVAYYWPDL